MITIRTGDLVGLMSDAIPFCSTVAELPLLNAVRLEWDGERLHALGTDRYRVAIATWDPDDEPDVAAGAQDDLFTEFGGADDPWQILVPLDDAKALVKIFKLPKKEAHCPITVDLVDGQLVIRRSRETGYSALSQTVAGEAGVYPDLRALLASKGPRAAKAMKFTACLLADFKKVRPRGPMELSFTGTDSMVHVTIGRRFVGAIMPIPPDKGEPDA